MNSQIRLTSPNIQLGVLLLAYFVPQLLGAGFIEFFLNRSADFLNPENITAWKLIQALYSLVSLLLPALVYAVVSFRGNYLHLLGFKKAEKSSMYMLGILCMLLAFPLVFWLGQLNHLIPLPASMLEMEKLNTKHMEAFMKVDGAADIIINLIVLALLPAFCEEVFFRGAMQRVFIHHTRNVWLGIVVTAALFSALHFQFQGFLPRMFSGVVIGALYWLSGSLWTSIAAHFVTNALQVIAASYATKYISENPVIPFYLALASAVAVYLILRLFRRMSNSTWSKIYEVNDHTPHSNFIS